MQTLYKLTNQDGYTRFGFYNACLWGEGVSHSGTGKGALCGPGYIHAYTHPLLAVLLNPIHAGIDNPRLWEAEGDVVLNDNGLKVGCRTLTTLRELPLPAVTTEQRVRFAIMCAMEVCEEPGWREWAENWLSGANRSREAARAAERAVWGAAAAEVAARAAAETVAWAKAARTLENNPSRPIDLIALAEQAMREEFPR